MHRWNARVRSIYLITRTAADRFVVPGILCNEERFELSTDDMLFTLEPAQFLQCTKSRAKSGVNWLSGTTEEDSEWSKVVRRCAQVRFQRLFCLTSSRS